jgi:mycoredoxin
MISDAPTLVMYTTAWCGDCVAAKRALEARGIPFVTIDLDDDPAAVAVVTSLNGGRRSVPTLVRGDVAASLSQFSPAKLDAFLRAASLA